MAVPRPTAILPAELLAAAAGAVGWLVLALISSGSADDPYEDDP